MKKLTLFAVLPLVLTLAACATVGTSPKGLEAPIEKAAIGLMADVQNGGYKLVDAEALNKWMNDKKEIVLIDTMPKEDFAKIRIKGAVNGPMPKSDKEITPYDKQTLLSAASGDKEKTIVVYCGFTACRRSHWGAKLLVEEGYKNVYRYPGGIVGWMEYQYPVDK